MKTLPIYICIPPNLSILYKASTMATAYISKEDNGKDLFSTILIDNYIDFVANHSNGDFIALIPDDNLLDYYYSTAIDYIETGQNKDLIATDLTKSFMWHSKHTDLLSFDDKATLKLKLQSWSKKFIKDYTNMLHAADEPAAKRQRLY